MKRNLEDIIDAGKLTSALIKQYGEMHVEGVARGILKNAIFPFMVSTRFSFKSLKEVRESTKRFHLVNESKTGRELLELFLFEKLARNKDLPLVFDTFLDGPDTSAMLDEAISNLHTKTNWKIRSWTTMRIFDQLAKLTSDYDLKKLGGISTPTELVGDMVCGLSTVGGKILDPACGRGIFLIDIRNRLIQSGMLDADAVAACHGWDIDPRKAYIAQALLDPEGKYQPTIECKNALEGEVDMKFDIVIGNPPYQDPNDTGSALWPSFVAKGMASLNDGGKLCFVTPPSWLTRMRGREYVTFGAYQINYVEFFDSTRRDQVFKGVGTNACWYVMSKESPNKDTEVVQYMNGQKQPAFFTRFDQINPGVVTPEAMSIQKKLLAVDRLPIISTREMHFYTMKKKGTVNDSDSPTEAFPHKVYFSHRIVRHASYKIRNHDSWKVMIPITSTLDKAFVDHNCSVSEDLPHVLATSQDDADRILSYIQNNIICKYIAKIYKTGAHLVGLEYLPNPKNGITDDDMIRDLGLTLDEVSFIRQQL